MKISEAQNLTLKEKYEEISRRSGQCIILCGPSGVGKTMSIEYLVQKYNYQNIPFITTRALRPGEAESGSKSLSYIEFMDMNLSGRVFLAARNYGNAYGHSIDDVYNTLVSGQKVILESPSSQLLTDVNVLLPNAKILGFITEDHTMTTEILSNRNRKRDIDAEIRILQSSIEVFNIELAQKNMTIFKIYPKLGRPGETIKQIDEALDGNT